MHENASTDDGIVYSLNEREKTITPKKAGRPIWSMVLANRPFYDKCMSMHWVYVLFTFERVCAGAYVFIHLIRFCFHSVTKRKQKWVR